MFGISFRKTSAEEQLLYRLRRGDDEAAQQLYRQHVRYLTALCSRYISQEDDLKDVLQESFLKIFAAVDTFKYRGEGSLRAWMARITLNEALSFLRTSARLNIVDIDEVDTDIANEEISTDDIPTEVLHRFVSQLPDGYRTVFNLYVVEDKSHKEIAQLLGITASTSATQLYKAKAALAKMINQYRINNSI